MEIMEYKLKDYSYDFHGRSVDALKTQTQR